MTIASIVATRECMDRAWAHGLCVGADSRDSAASAWYHLVGAMADRCARLGLSKPDWCDQEFWDSCVAAYREYRAS